MISKCLLSAVHEGYLPVKGALATLTHQTIRPALLKCANPCQENGK